MHWEANQAIDAYQCSRDSSCVDLNHKKQETLRAGALPQHFGLKWPMRKDAYISLVALVPRDECSGVIAAAFSLSCPTALWLMPEGCWQLPQQVLPHALGAPAQVPSLASQGDPLRALPPSQVRSRCFWTQGYPQSPAEVPRVV